MSVQMIQIEGRPMLARRHFLALTAATPLVALAANRVLAATPPVYSNDGIAVDGTDMVAYFTQAEPVKGSSENTHDWNGAIWQFASAANRDAFAAQPDAYAPQYGGYCAWAVSQGYTASTTPDAWKIVDGKLYLNFSRRIQRRWERDMSSRIAAADANWPGVLS